jgi:hypothetical protein
LARWHNTLGFLCGRGFFLSMGFLESREVAMAGFGDFLENGVAKGVVIGLGMVAAGVVLAPALRPAARAAVKTGILLFEKGREWAAEAGETFEDLVAEVRAELAEQAAAAEGFEAAEQAAAESDMKG